MTNELIIPMKDGETATNSTFIQWKGTDVCMDWTCEDCGARYHIDADFCYFVKCGACGALFEVGTSVVLTKRVGPDQEDNRCIVYCDPDEYPNSPGETRDA